MSLQNRPLLHLKFYDYSVFLKTFEIGKVLHNLIDTNGLGVKIENEVFTVVGLRYRHSVVLVLFA